MGEIARAAFSALPGRPVASADVSLPRDFLVCPYPMRSVFEQRKAAVPGAVLEAGNWSCQLPRK
jgi:hypothetical protein